MPNKPNNPDAESIFNEYEKGKGFNNQINLDDTVETNENFFIGKQWEGVQSNGLPTPVFNFLKRVVLFQVASNLSDNIKMQASPLSIASNQAFMEMAGDLISAEFEALFEQNKISSLLREYMRNAAVDGDGCLYTYWDADVDMGQTVKGAITTEIIENTRVLFGNPNERRAQRQPYIIIESREMLDSVKDRAQDNGVADLDLIQTDTSAINAPSRMSDNRVTVLLRMWKDRKTGHIWACEAVRGVIIREPWDMEIKLYPITWLNWDYIQDCYHGQAMITGLIPNQIFVNKTFAMVQLSLMQSAFPKTVYDKTRISKWSNQVGTAIGVNGGDMNQIAKIIEPAQVSPQIAQFIDSTINYTQSFLGASDASLGDARPDNTSAIVALQRASSVPSELTKQNLYQSVEDLGHIYLEFIISNYGKRTVKAPATDTPNVPSPNGLINPNSAAPATIEFDFGTLKDTPMSLKLDVGASSYWSEIASMQTLDNMLMQNKIDTVDYLERVPPGYIPKKQELIDKLTKAQTAPQIPQGGGSNPISPNNSPTPIPIGAGNGTLQREVLNKQNAV